MSENQKESQKEKKEIKKGLRAIARHVRPFRGTIILLSFLGLISAIANGFVPYVTGHFFDALIGVSQHHATTFTSGLPLWAFFLGAWTLIQLVANNTDWVLDRLHRKVETEVHFKMQVDGFVHMFRLPFSYHKNAHTNGDLQKISMASWRVSHILATMVNITPQFLSVLIGIVLSASISPLLAGVLLLGVVCYVLLLIKILLPIAAIDSRAHRSWNQGWDDAAASVQQVESVKQATAEEYEINKVHANLLTNTKNLWFRLNTSWSNVSFFQRTIVFVTQLVVFILSIALISKGDITVGELVALNGYASMFFGPFVALGSSWQIIQNGITTAAQSEDIFDEEEEVYVPKDAVTLEHMSGAVEFRDVSFKYGSEQPSVLSSISLTIQPGSVVALVGESGVGKSTLASLISGYYFPTEGSVLVDGVDTRSLNLIALRKHIAVVPQEVALFNDTIMANIRYGTDALPVEVKHVAKEAHMEEFIHMLPDQYETLVGERGIKLSVGQKQRVAIARAMLRDPAILILDEPTSALDARTEQIITESLEKLMKGRTTFIIAHRLSTVRKADLIIVFEKGTISERGTHEELMKKEHGTYRRLYELQVGLH